MSSHPTETLSADRFTVAEASSGDIADEWCRLLRESSNYPFQHPAWHQAWWNRFGAERAPRLLTVRDGDRLVMVAPLMRDGEQLLFAGDPEICDYMDVIAGADVDSGAYASLLTAIEAEPWQQLLLWGIPEDSPTLRFVPELARARGWQVEEEVEAVCPQLTLPATWDDYLATLSKKDRHELRRKMRRFSEAGGAMTLYALREPDAVRAGLDDFLRLHTISRQDKHEFMTTEMELFFREMSVGLAADDLTRLFFVELDGRRVAGLLAFDTGTELLLYNSGYDPAYSHASVGLVSKALTLQSAIQSGERCYDFLRGAEPYKYDLGAKDREVRRLIIERTTPV